MSFQPVEEKIAERELIMRFVDTFPGKMKIVKLQSNIDDGEEDGIIELQNGKQVGLEARRKGFPNHRGKTCYFPDGWETSFLKSGIFLNELTLKRYLNQWFLYIVEIKDYKPRVAVLSPERVSDCLSQPYKEQRSTNSCRMQSVKAIPLEWFREFGLGMK